MFKNFIILLLSFFLFFSCSKKETQIVISEPTDELKAGLTLAGPGEGHRWAGGDDGGATIVDGKLFIAEYNGKLSIIDFKTSTKERSDAWNESYYIQASAYAEMFEERTGIEINQICILVVTEDGVVQEFVKDKTEYLPLLSDTIKEWEEKNEMVTSTDIAQSV